MNKINVMRQLTPLTAELTVRFKRIVRAPIQEGQATTPLPIGQANRADQFTVKPTSRRKGKQRL